VRISRIANVLGALCIVAGAHAQSREVPGRDLLAFPIGLMAEPAGLPGTGAFGVWSPADAALPDGASWRGSLVALTTPSDLAMSAQAATLSHRIGGYTVYGSWLRAAVAGIYRTDSDPLTIGNEVPYATSVGSIGAVRSFGRHLTAGVAARVRTGRIDFVSRRSVALDAGVVADHLTPFDARLAASTFLASPWATASERASISLAADARVSPEAASYRVRAGIASLVTQRGPTDTFAHAALWIAGWDAHAGLALTDAYGSQNTRSRFGLGFTYGKYHIALAREASPADLGSSYQFALTTTWP
jgi:hypothetical protein